MSSSQPRHAGPFTAPTDEAETLRQFHSEAYTLEAEKLKASDARVMRQSTAAGWRGWPSHRREILLGRALATCVHPFAAWRLCSTFWRLWILTAYTAAGYVIVLGVLFVLGHA
jgi:hypothetical protein